MVYLRVPVYLYNCLFGALVIVGWLVVEYNHVVMLEHTHAYMHTYRRSIHVNIYIYILTKLCLMKYMHTCHCVCMCACMFVHDCTRVCASNIQYIMIHIIFAIQSQTNKQVMFRLYKLLYSTKSRILGMKICMEGLK